MFAIHNEATMPLPSQTVPTHTSWLGEVLRRLTLFPALRLFVPLQVTGIENLAGEGPFIFAANHASHLDAPLLLAALPLHLRLRLRVAAAADYFFTSRWKGALVSTLLNAFAFERKGTGCAHSLAHAQELVRAGYSLLLFPEGTRTKNGHIQHFKHGISRIAQGSSATVVPTYIDGTFAALPKGSRLPHRHKVIIRFGASMHFRKASDPVEVASAIEQQVHMLSKQDMLSN